MSGSSMTFTVERYGSISKIICDWVSDSSTGAASGTTNFKAVGELRKVITDPAAGGSAPTDNYDISVADEAGLDVLANIENASALDSRDTANTEQTDLYLKNTDASALGISAFPVVADKLTVAVANAGNTKAGQIVLFLKGEIVGNP